MAELCAAPRLAGRGIARMLHSAQACDCVIVRWLQHLLQDLKMACIAMALTREQKLLVGRARVLEMIARGAPVKQSMTALLELRESMVEGMVCSIRLLADDGVHLSHLAAPSLPTSYIKDIDGVSIGPRTGACDTAAFQREIAVCPDIQNDPLWVEYRSAAISHGLRAAWSAPIFDSQQRVLGTFDCYFQTARQPAKEDLEELQAATQMASIALSRARDERLQGEREAANAARLALTISAGSVGLWDWDLNTNQVDYSREWKQLLGLGEHELEGDLEAWRSRLHPAEAARMLKQVKDYIANPYPGFHAEYRLRHRDGSYRWICSQATVVRDAAGKPVRMLGSHIDVTDRKRHKRELQELAQRYQAVSRRLLEAEASERKLLARELHDRVGQNLSLLMMNLALLRSALPEPYADDLVHRLDDSERLLSQTLKEVRTVMADLRPAELDDFGLDRALKFHAEAAGRRSGFSVRFHRADPVVPLQIGAETAVYRIAQEALTNISKHADATEVSITLADDAEYLTLTIADNGRGIGSGALATTDHRGIRGMQERAQSLSANLLLQDAPGGGTCVTLRVPRVVDDPPAGTQSRLNLAVEERVDV
jgi:two-component system sensor histidine kinase UhpB